VFYSIWRKITKKKQIINIYGSIPVMTDIAVNVRQELVV